MRKIADNLSRMPRSGIRVILDLAAGRDKVFHLELGEPGFQTPEHINRAAEKAIREGYTKYTANVGLLSLREAILEKVRRDNGIEAELGQVAVTPGSVFALASAVMSVTDPGDEVLVPDPGWPNYHMQAVALGLKTVYYPLRAGNGYQPRAEDIDPLVTPRTRAMFINTPSNPTGAVYSEKTVSELVELARKHDFYLISDEVYEKIIFEGQHFSPAALDPDGRVISVFAASKTYAMTGWRIGYYVAPTQVVPVMSKALEPLVACAATVSQKAAEAALRGPQECVAEMVSAYAGRRDLVVKILEKNGLSFIKPSGAFYLLMDIGRTGLGSYDFATRLLEETGVAVAPGLTFGPDSDHLIRISFCARTEELEEGVGRLCAFHKNLAAKG